MESVVNWNVAVALASSALLAIGAVPSSKVIVPAGVAVAPGTGLTTTVNVMDWPMMLGLSELVTAGDVSALLTCWVIAPAPLAVEVKKFGSPW